MKYVIGMGLMIGILLLVPGLRLRVVRSLLRLPPPVITGEQAVEIARREFGIMDEGQLYRQEAKAWVVRALNEDNEALDVYIDNQDGRILGLRGWLEAAAPPDLD